MPFIRTRASISIQIHSVHLHCEELTIEYTIQFKYKLIKHNQTVNDGVAHSKNPKKCAYHVTFDLDLEHTLDAR